MKVVFAGPSIYPSLDFRKDFSSAAEWRGPACQGDIAQAVRDGASAIALIDGLYGTVASVWHKEILFALSKGVRVIGGASLGAIRAAECARFGMEGVGWIYQFYASGELNDDSAVALLHAPAEFDYAPLTIPLVDAEATICGMAQQCMFDVEKAHLLIRSAREIFFWDRTPERIVLRAGISGHRATWLERMIEDERVSLKREDAHRVIQQLFTDMEENPPAYDWSPAETRAFRLVSNPPEGKLPR